MSNLYFIFVINTEVHCASCLTSNPLLYWTDLLDVGLSFNNAILTSFVYVLWCVHFFAGYSAYTENPVNPVQAKNVGAPMGGQNAV